jgi:hypothetical protein
MQVWKFEKKVYEIEGVRIIVRANTDATVEEFDFERCASGNTTLADWLARRIYPYTGDYEVTVVSGSGALDPHGKTHMSTLRDSYAV